MLWCKRVCQCACAVSSLLVAMPSPIATAAPVANDARLDVFAKEDAAYFVLRLSPAITPPPRIATDVVILFDTSASQAGEYRTKALAVLETVLAALHQHDRIHLLAVDLNAIPLTNAFVSPTSKQMVKALTALRERVPLGATDMVATLSAAGESFAAVKDGSRRRAALYIGDGMSGASMLAPEVVGPRIDQLRDLHVPFNSYAIGPRLDSALLACVARQTGGVLAVDTDDLNASQVGNWLAAALPASVVWPTSIELPQALRALSGARGLPLRFDRDTILIGSGSLSSPAVVKVNANADGHPIELSWQLAPAQSNTDYSFLEYLVEAGQRDGGVNLPTLGSKGLAEVRRRLFSDAKGLDRLARVALASGDSAHALRLATQALEINAADSEAGTLMRLAEKAEKSGSDAPTIRFGLLNDDMSNSSSPADLDGGLLDAVDRERRVLQQSVQTEVRTAVNEARKQMAISPDSVIEGLKIELERVRKTPELDAGLRGQLAGQLETALQDASRRSSEKFEREIHQQEVQAESDARKELNRELVINEEKAEQLLARFNALLDERRFRDAEEEANRATELNPPLRYTPEPGRTTATVMGPIEARTRGYVYDMQELVRPSTQGCRGSLVCRGSRTHPAVGRATHHLSVGRRMDVEDRTPQEVRRSGEHVPAWFIRRENLSRAGQQHRPRLRRHSTVGRSGLHQRQARH
jgi:tetratricopeptide (TPR) repeat protein